MVEALSRKPHVVLDRSWWSFAGPHGGYVGSHLLAAAARLTEHPPRSLHVQFCAAAEEGEAAVDATVVREGRSASFVTAELARGGRVAARASAVFGPARTGPRLAASPVPEVDPPEKLSEFAPPAEMAPFVQHFEYRPAAGDLPFSGGPAEFFVWARFRDDRPLYEAATTVLVDALPPAMYGPLPAPVPIPTADLYVHFTGAGTGAGWTLLRIVTRSAGDGWCVDDSEVWTPGGRLLATARQTRLVLDGAA